MGFWKKLGKIASIAAPIAAAPFTGGTSLALIGAGAGAANAALSGKGLKGALLGGMMGVIPGVGKATGALGGVKGKLLQGLLSGDTLNTIGQGLGAIGQTQAHNRGVALDAMMAGDQNRILAEKDRRDAESDIMKKIQIANYLKGGGFQDTGPGVSASGKPFTKFDFGTRPAGESEKTMASELELQLMNRLRNPLQLSDYKSKMDPSGMEKTLNWLGPITQAIGVARGAGKYQLPQIGAPTQTPTPAAPPFTPAPVNPAGGNPWSRVEFTKDKILGS